MKPIPKSMVAHNRGFTMVEMMIAMAIGVIVLSGLTAMFVVASNKQRDFSRQAQQYENGRYGIETLAKDLQLAGFYGYYSSYATPASMPDPCYLGTDANTYLTALGLPVYGYHAADKDTRASAASGFPSSCSAWLDDTNLQPGSDIVVLQRADTTDLRTTAANTVDKDIYLHANASNAAIQIGNGSAAPVLVSAKGSTPSPVRKLHVHIYFVAPCSIPADDNADGLCTGSGDDGGHPIPTLKRLELGSDGTTRTMRIVPLAEGVEFLRVDWGLDTGIPFRNATTDSNGQQINSATRLPGDGAADEYVSAPTTPAQFANTVSARISMLVRNPESSAHFKDMGQYAVGSLGTLGPFNDGYRRHVFAADVRLTNLSARRENP